VPRPLPIRFFLQERAYQWRTPIYLTASASAEFFADMMLAPMVCIFDAVCCWLPCDSIDGALYGFQEATKVRIQTSPTAPPTLRGCAQWIYKTEGFTGFFKGLPPLWLRQIPYTMVKFATFERTIELVSGVAAGAVMVRRSPRLMARGLFSALQEGRPEAARGVLKAGTAGRHIRCWIHRRGRLQRHFLFPLACLP
jgi:hypothetical protein